MNVTRCPRCRTGRAAAVGWTVRCYFCGQLFEAEVGISISEPFEHLYPAHTVNFEPLRPTGAEIVANVAELERRLYRAQRVPAELLVTGGAGSRASAALVASGKWWVLPPACSRSLYGWHARRLLCARGLAPVRDADKLGGSGVDPSG